MTTGTSAQPISFWKLVLAIMTAFLLLAVIGIAVSVALTTLMFHHGLRTGTTIVRTIPSR